MDRYYVKKTPIPHILELGEIEGFIPYENSFYTCDKRVVALAYLITSRPDFMEIRSITGLGGKVWHTDAPDSTPWMLCCATSEPGTQFLNRIGSYYTGSQAARIPQSTPPDFTAIPGRIYLVPTKILHRANPNPNEYPSLYCDNRILSRVYLKIKRPTPKTTLATYA